METVWSGLVFERLHHQHHSPNSRPSVTTAATRMSSSGPARPDSTQGTDSVRPAKREHPPPRHTSGDLDGAPGPTPRSRPFHELKPVQYHLLPRVFCGVLRSKPSLRHLGLAAPTGLSCGIRYSRVCLRSCKRRQDWSARSTIVRAGSWTIKGMISFLFFQNLGREAAVHSNIFSYSKQTGNNADFQFGDDGK